MIRPVQGHSDRAASNLIDMIRLIFIRGMVRRGHPMGMQKIRGLEEEAMLIFWKGLREGKERALDRVAERPGDFRELLHHSMIEGVLRASQCTKGKTKILLRRVVSSLYVYLFLYHPEGVRNADNVCTTLPVRCIVPFDLLM